jgi:hypothetical protein
LVGLIQPGSDRHMHSPNASKSPNVNEEFVFEDSHRIDNRGIYQKVLLNPNRI